MVSAAALPLRGCPGEWATGPFVGLAHGTALAPEGRPEAAMESMVLDGKRQAYLESIRARVCAVCLDSRDDGSCGLTGRGCAIEAHLPGVVDAILATRSQHVDDYLTAIRSQVCSRCSDQDGAGLCAVRGAGDCALNAYLSLVVDAVEAVDARG